MNKKLISYSKIIFYNIAIFLILITSPSILYSGYNQYKAIKEKLIDKKALNSPALSDIENAEKLFGHNITKKYKSFLGWRKDHYSSEYINISGFYHTRNSSGESLKNSTWFFGGSTIWGTGVADKETIPSYFNKHTNKAVQNFGESGWVSRQSLNRLINLIGDEHNPKRIIFYSGVNDIHVGCRQMFKYPPANAREYLIQSRINNSKSLFNHIYSTIITPYEKIALKIKSNRNPKESLTGYDCHLNEVKSKKIASHLVNNWYTAYLVAKANKSEFHAILQPNIFTTTPKYKYQKDIIKSNKTLKLQYQTVYPLILKEVKNKCFQDESFCESFIDARSWIAGDLNVYIDFCHLNREGNKIIAKKFINKIGLKLM